MSSDIPLPGRRLPREQRREQILVAAGQTFAGRGFAATSLDEVAVAAGVSRAILYRHFDSKADLYREVLARAWERLHVAVGAPPYAERIVDDLLAAAAADPAGFRLLFHHAAREPEFRTDSDRFAAAMVTTAQQELALRIADTSWRDWAAHLTPATTVAAIIAWLDAGRPDPATAPNRIRQVLRAIITSAKHENRY